MERFKGLLEMKYDQNKSLQEIKILNTLGTRKKTNQGGQSSKVRLNNYLVY